MKCPHCLVEFCPEPTWDSLGADAEGHWGVEHYLCPNDKCGKRIVYLVLGNRHLSPRGVTFRDITKRILVHPKGSSRPPVPPEVPPVIAQDYTEACIVLPDSPKASAALSRTCLQRILREVAKVKPGNLADEIQQVIDGGTLPSHLCESIDAIRNIGNFAAHPAKSQKTGEVVPIEPGEAEWNLDVLESLFDFYLVQPAAIKKKREALDAKLKDAGRSPMK